MPMTNGERADHAEAGLAAYLRSKGEYDSPRPLDGFIEDYEIADLICDLLHLSDRLGHDPLSQISRAMLHYEPERAEAQP